MSIPISSSITPRPVWNRRQQRHYRPEEQLLPPSAEEMHDAIAVLSDPQMQFEAPDLYLEAEMIHQEATEAA